LTIRRFAEIAWTQHWLARYGSLAIAPVAVALTVPGNWWMVCVAFTLVGIAIDRHSSRAFRTRIASMNVLGGKALRAVLRRYVTALALITACYSTPYALLSLAPHPGPILGLIFCSGAALVCASMHVMTRSMIFYSAPILLIGLAVNGLAAAGNEQAPLVAFLAVLIGANAIIMARAGARNFAELVAARARAEVAAEELEERVRERTAQLEEATHRAQAANNAKTVFLANMSHELRTPLNAVIGYAELVEEEIAEGRTEQCVADLAKIRASARHLLAMINEVLDFSRIEAGRLELMPSAFDLSALLASAVDTVRPIAAKNDTECSVSIEEGIGVVTADETRVRQCVLNLLSNAAKFTEGGRVSLVAERCTYAGAPAVAISVYDTGRGISREDLSRLFQPFVQADASATRKHDGAGLGLVITRRLARAMGGDVVAESELGEGSTFTLYLPIRAVEAQRAAA